MSHPVSFALQVFLCGQVLRLQVLLLANNSVKLDALFGS